MPKAYEFTVTSQLAARAADVWAHAATMRGVNRELFPLARMTWPKTIPRIDQVSPTPERRLFRSWILLLGFLPVDYDDLTIVSLDLEGGFLEDSKMLSQKRWQHQRLIRSIPGGCTVTDHVQFIPRVPAMGGLYRLVFKLCFAQRHRNLRRMFGHLE